MFLSLPFSDDNNLNNLTWNEIQQRLRIAQQEFQMCIHKSDLTELDIYHRILRLILSLITSLTKCRLKIKADKRTHMDSAMRKQLASLEQHHWALAEAETAE